MVEIIRDPIRMNQVLQILNRIGLGSDLSHEFRSNLKSSYFHLKFILGSVMKSEREKDSRETKFIKREKKSRERNRERI